MRDIIVHSYETIDKLILWNVADKEIIKIKKFCKKIINLRWFLMSEIEKIKPIAKKI